MHLSPRGLVCPPHPLTICSRWGCLPPTPPKVFPARRNGAAVSWRNTFPSSLAGQFPKLVQNITHFRGGLLAGKAGLPIGTGRVIDFAIRAVEAAGFTDKRDFFLGAALPVL